MHSLHTISMARLLLSLMGTVEDQLQRTMHISVEKPKLQIRSTYQMQQNSLGKRTISLPKQTGPYIPDWGQLATERLPCYPC